MDIREYFLWLFQIIIKKKKNLFYRIIQKKKFLVIGKNDSLHFF